MALVPVAVVAAAVVAAAVAAAVDTGDVGGRVVGEVRCGIALAVAA